MDIHYVTTRSTFWVASSKWMNLMTLLEKCYVSYRIIRGVTYVEVSKTERVFMAEKILIATGSLPFHPPNIPFDDPDIFDSEGLPKLNRVPENALVVGGGAIGCEFASIFNALGIPVTVVHSGEHLLGTMDSEMSDLLRRTFEKQGMRFVLGTGVQTAGRVNGELQVFAKFWINKNNSRL